MCKFKEIKSVDKKRYENKNGALYWSLADVWKRSEFWVARKQNQSLKSWSQCRRRPAKHEKNQNFLWPRKLAPHLHASTFEWQSSAVPAGLRLVYWLINVKRDEKFEKSTKKAKKCQVTASKPNSVTSISKLTAKNGFNRQTASKSSLIDRKNLKFSHIRGVGCEWITSTSNIIACHWSSVRESDGAIRCGIYRWCNESSTRWLGV